MEHKLTDEQIDRLKNVREAGNKIIYDLGLNAMRQHELFGELGRVNNLNEQITQEILNQYGEGELKMDAGVFITKEV